MGSIVQYSYMDWWDCSTINRYIYVCRHDMLFFGTKPKTKIKGHTISIAVAIANLLVK